MMSQGFATVCSVNITKKELEQPSCAAFLPSKLPMFGGHAWQTPGEYRCFQKNALKNRHLPHNQVSDHFSHRCISGEKLYVHAPSGPYRYKFNQMSFLCECVQFTHKLTVIKSPS